MYLEQNNFQERLRSWRTSHDLTREELGDKLGYSVHAIYAWEHGSRLPGFDAIVALVEIMGCSADWLLFGDSA